MYVCECLRVCSVEGKNGFDTEIKLGIVTRHCLAGTRDELGGGGDEGRMENREREQQQMMERERDIFFQELSDGVT